MRSAITTDNGRVRSSSAKMSLDARAGLEAGGDDRLLDLRAGVALRALRDAGDVERGRIVPALAQVDRRESPSAD